MAGSFSAQNFQKSKKFHQLQRKLFNFKPLTPTHPVLGDTGRGREEEGRSKEAGKEEGGRREERGMSEGGGEAGGRTKVIVRELEGRNLSGGREGDEWRGGGREGEEEGRRRELEGRKVGGGRRKDGGREKRGRRGGRRVKVGLRELEGRKLGQGRRE